MTETAGGIAIYHEMRAGEDFLATAAMLWAVVRGAARKYPGRARHLCLDIEGHGGKDYGKAYDDEAGEVISFTRAALGPFLTTTPWGKAGEDAAQLETLPDVIVTFGENGRPCVLTGDHERPVHDGPGMLEAADPDSAIIAAIYVRPGGAFATEQEITT